MSDTTELINSHYGDRYFSAAGGLDESRHVFVDGNDMTARFSARRGLVVAETGFGTGLNLLASLLILGEGGKDGILEWFSVEKYPLAGNRIAAALAGFPELAAILPRYLAAYPDDGAWTARWQEFGFAWREIQVRVAVFHGDVLEMLSRLPERLPVQGLDCWVLDGHSPALNPDMWSPAVFGGMAACSRRDPATRFATYTAAGSVKQGLRQAGFTVRRQPGFGAKRHMISGAFAPSEPGRRI